MNNLCKFIAAIIILISLTFFSAKPAFADCATFLSTFNNTVTTASNFVSQIIPNANVSEKMIVFRDQILFAANTQDAAIPYYFTIAAPISNFNLRYKVPNEPKGNYASIQNGEYVFSAAIFDCVDVNPN